MQRGNSKKKEKRYCVVSFSDDEEDLFIVSSRWLTQGKSDYICLWPPYKGDARIKRAVMEEERPSSSWLTCSAKLIKKCKSYESAENFLNTVLLVSNRRSCILLHKEGDSIGSGSESPLKRIKIEADSDIFASNCAGSSSSDSNERPASPAVRESGTMVTVAEIVEESSTECSSPPPAVVTRSSNSSSAYEFLMENTSGQAHEEPSSAQDVVDNFNRSLEGYHKKVLSLLGEIRKEQKEQRTLIEQICRRRGEGNRSLPEECPQLPVNSPEQLAEFNHFLGKDENFVQICDFLAFIGGFTQKDIIRRMLQCIMTNSLSTRYNWKGMGGVKLAFCPFTNILKVIAASVRRHSAHSKATDNEVEACVKRWLMYAKDRDGGRSLRAKHVSVIE